MGNRKDTSAQDRLSTGYADAVWILERSDLPADAEVGQAELIILKNPCGPTGTPYGKGRRMKLTDAALQCSAAYEATPPKRLGNLHERMKLVVALMCDERQRALVSEPLWLAVWDLQTEVRYHRPATPPYGRRAFRPDPTEKDEL